ncbi:2-hydroxyacid dehydrogenase [Nocardioides sp. zg-536]|uniref:2-hydroxyacid dehydrogenase n=1 Tax=Nocardioides faecalis TaxID=2803858 RepID=A0A938Y483_9ACTN|nr:2-hydroxyacid dehydrogenase [Nocardioides faecalis]MBM9461596.1 2-hydroxyacid dehydrogenase [Nocardioides faecalis]QVI57771.1 2-hydroxyacid dehydrogenase [Nocardioides faecalis]
MNARTGTTRTGTVLRVPPISPELHAATGERYDALDLPGDPGDPGVADDPARAAFLAEHGGDVVAIVCSNLSPVPASLIEALPRLGVIANHGVGYDNVDVDVALARGIAVSHTPDVLDDAVAETALALLLAARRRIVTADLFVRDGAWSKGAFPLTDQVSGSRVGILGLGRIGRAVARRLEAFGCAISYHNRRPVPGVDYAYAASPAELAAGVDNLIVIVPGGPGTEGLVDAAVLDALGPRGLLVNVARGSVVDEDALVAALQEGRLGGAALDVFAREPEVPAALLVRDDVVLAPHVGSATHETRAAMRRLTLDNLDDWLATGTLRTPIPEMSASPGEGGER